MKKKWIDLLEYIVIIGIVVCLNILLFQHFFRLDLTEDKRFSLAPVTKEILQDLDEKVYVTVYLAGPMDPDYERLKKTVKEKLEELNIYAKKGLEFRFFDPNSIEDKKIRENFYGQLVQKGVQYRYYLEEEGGKKEEKIIFPGAIISYKEKEVPVMFMKGKKVVSKQEELNQAVEGVEYELVSGLRKLSSKDVKNIAFVEGHGELPKENVSDITASLYDFYNVDRISLSDSSDLSKYSTLIVAAPQSPFSEKEKYRLDQYLMNGGGLMFLIDPLNVHKDSLVNGVTYALPYDLNIQDLLFKYGLRLNPTLIQDKFSGVIRVQTALNQQSQVISYPFYPVIYNFSKHPIVKNLDAVITRFVSTMDTVKAQGVSKIPLLLTSKDTRIFNTPIQINLDNLRENTDPASFNAGTKVVGYLLEGSFTSLYKNRPLPVSGNDFKESSSGGKVIVVSDGNIIKNEFNPDNKEPIPLGYDINMRYQFSNKEFLMNAVDYLSGEDIVNIRGKEVKIRPLDKEVIQESKTKWQIINIVVPIVLIIVFGAVRFYIRKKKYTNF